MRQLRRVGVHACAGKASPVISAFANDHLFSISASPPAMTAELVSAHVQVTASIDGCCLCPSFHG